MTAPPLRTVIGEALSEIGATQPAGERGRPRETVWLPHERGIGVHIYASGRRVYIAQAVMGGRQRTVTIGPASVISEAQTIAVARRVLAQALVGDDPAAARKRLRAAPDWQPFLEEYWRICSSIWKPSTRQANEAYRRLYLDRAFDTSIDAIDVPRVTRWFTRVTQRSGPGGANRCMAMLSAMMTKAEA
ncbi:integrase arm-type DNA-binding domain-containing protein [Sphingomonas bacterium]|uniref:integrase arm-type DNA-binding domain-containing protein n=1 Tax=Sphingomonas bacterium TaxID=1895847 RepID=UPI001575F657|nr:integrase arm-type DNA-binding domain-containing protein [Sphingomonas bacterium]